MKIIDDQLLNRLAEEAKKSPRLRKNYNFHQSLQDKCHRFLNALEPGTFIPVHHHPDKDETFVAHEVDGILETKPTKDIYLAGGCFWGTEHYFKQIEGVAVTEVGFANGHTEHPTYKEVYTHDEGTRYRTGVYYTDPEDLPVIEKVFAEEQKNYDQPLAVEKLPLQNFYTAEEYHKDYLDKNPDGYCHLPLSLFEFARQAKEK